jgi:predicted nucleic acid-binding Zn ribbon protein
MAVIPKPYRQFKLGPPKMSAQQRVLAQWRGVDVAPLEIGRTASRKASDLMPKVLANLRMDKRRAEAEVVKVWNNLIDPQIVAHAQPTGLHKGTLFVTVDSSPWLDEIVRYRRKEILNRLQHSFGTGVVTKISFRVG